MADIIDVNIGDSTLDVFWQDEVELNLDMALMYIKSGEAEIQKYVDEVSKPEISNYVETEANPLVTQIVNEIAEPTVMEYIEGTVKPDLDEYADSLKPELQAYVTQASNYADNSQASATASAGSAAAALTSANNAKTSETNAKTYENNALSSKNAAASSATSASNYANNSKIWAEGTDSQVQALGGTHSAKGWAEASTNLDYTDITNCLTSIPQDIKLELNNGTLTLKAGSKVYVPNGVGVFDEVITQQDISAPNYGSASGLTIVCVKGMSLKFAGYNQSGGTIPSSNCIWYDTQNNRVVFVNDGSIADTGYSLPIGFVERTNGNFTSIDQVFNGFGYIGNTIFALPGVEGLIPNGFVVKQRNNIKFTTSSVLTRTNPNKYAGTIVITLRNDNLLEIDASAYGYDKDKNINYNTILNEPFEFINAGTYSTDSTGRITSFNPKTVFQAPDYQDVPKLATDNKFSGVNTFEKDILAKRVIESVGNAFGDLWVGTNNGETFYAQLRAMNKSGVFSFIEVAVDGNGTVRTSAPTPATTDNSTQIATTNWFNQKIQVVSTLPANPNANVYYFVTNA